jgi:hypothetical protein
MGRCKIIEKGTWKVGVIKKDGGKIVALKGAVVGDNES